MRSTRERNILSKTLKLMVNRRRRIVDALIALVFILKREMSSAANAPAAGPDEGPRA
jgi:hypothetical protein